MLSILIIDGDHNVRVTLRDSLERLGHKVTSATNGKNGLEELRRMQPLPSVLVVDLQTSIMNGTEFITAIKAIPEFSHIPILAISSEDKIKPDGACALLMKPLVLNTFIETIKKHCTLTEV